MIGVEHRYNPIKKECLALVFTVEKMQHYLTGQRIQVISKVNPLRLLMTSPSSLHSRLAKWAILLSQYEMQFMLQKAVKGQVVVAFLVDHLVSGTSRLYDNLPDEIAKVNLTNASSEEQVWQLFFDGASRISPEENIITCVGVVLISPHDYVISRAFSLTEPCSNNVLEYNALLIGTQLAKEIEVKNLNVYSDSKLIVNLACGEYEV